MPSSVVSHVRACVRLLVPVTCAALAACGADPLSVTPAARSTPSFAQVATQGATQDNAALQWSAVVLDAVRAVRPGPPMVARALAIVHTAMYDAWAAYDPVAVGTIGAVPRRPAEERTDAAKRAAVSYAAYRALVDLYPGERPRFDARMAALGYDPADASSDPSTPAGVGNLAAAAVLDVRHRDGANQLGDLHVGAYSDWTGYVGANGVDALNDPSLWQPLRMPTAQGGTVVQTFLAPHWGRVTPFALPSGSAVRPKRGPAIHGTGRYVAQVEEIVKITANLDDRRKTIAEYWADGPASELPPGHWCLFAEWVSRRDGHTLDQDVKMFFALSNAMLDASIAAWDAKRTWESVRPVTAVRALKAGKPVRGWGGPGRGTVLMRGEEWMPYQPATFLTPPFPEFVSGHSTFSAAAAEILARFTGSDAFGLSLTIPAGWSRIEPGVTPARPVVLSWPTFSAAADEAGMSRRYGGIHFADGDEAGRVMGRAVGATVWARAQSLFEGSTATVAAR